MFTFLDTLLTLKGEQTQPSWDVILPLNGGLLNTFDKPKTSGNQGVSEFLLKSANIPALEGQSHTLYELIQSQPYP